MRFATALRFDIRFQIRHGFYAVYAVVTLLYILVLRALPEQVRDVLLPVVVFTDPALLGLIFIGAIVLLEKEERTLESLFVTPLRLGEYLASRLLSLGLLSVSSSVVIVVGVTGRLPAPYLFFPGVLLTAGIFTLLGFAVAARVRSFNEFVFAAAGVMLPACVPLVDHFGLVHSPLFYIFPTRASLLLIRGHSTGAAEAVYAFAYLAVWFWLAWCLAAREFRARVIGRTGDGS
jgi:fluoroquinolone transport system permease protein